VSKRIRPPDYLARWSSRPTPDEAAKVVQDWIEAQPTPTTRTRALTAMLKAKGLWVEREPPELVHAEPRTFSAPHRRRS